MSTILTIGEPMALFVADQEGPLEDIEHFTRYVAGAEVNFAIGMARLGHNVAYMTKVGEDPFGKYIYKFLQKNNIQVNYVKFDKDHLTGFQLKEKASGKDPLVVSYRKNSAASHFSLKDVQDIAWEGVKHIHLTGIFPALSASCREVIYEFIATAKRGKIRISFDPNLRPKLWNNKETMIQVINDLACRCDLVLPGLQEGKLLTGSEDIDSIADFYLKAGVQAVLIKLGAQGCFVKTPHETFTVPACKVAKVVDTVGAGDGFAVGVVSGLLEGLPLRDAAVRGNAIGALAVMSPGDNDGLPDREQLDAYLRAQSNTAMPQI